MLLRDSLGKTVEALFLALTRLFLFVAPLALVAAPPARAPHHDWPQFRGPALDGSVSDTALVTVDTPAFELLWKRPLGSGYASISVVGVRGVTLFSDGKSDFVMAFETATGKELWRHRIGEVYRGHDGSADGPLSTPAIADGSVYALGAAGELIALGLEDGTLRWQAQVGYGEPSHTPEYGYATSPVVRGGLVLVQTGGPEGHAITAFDSATGRVRWSAGDDSVSYQSPVLMELGRSLWIIAVADHFVFGIEPATGRVDWKARHTEQGNAGGASGLPVRLDPNRFLMRPGPDSIGLWRLESSNAGAALETVWRSDSLLKRSHAAPVVYEGYVYSFDSTFLTCIDAATGERKWKSRAPGGRGLILVDGHLIVLGSKGDLVLIRATPEGYVEVARLPLFDAGGWTPPSFADDRVFVRNLEQFAALRIVEGNQTSHARRSDIGGELIRLTERIREVPPAERMQIVDTFVDARRTWPWVEDDGWVHFLFRGSVDDLAVSGNFTADFGEEVALQRVAGTDLFVRSFRLDPTAHYEYRFHADFGGPKPDPLNPHLIDSNFGIGSELRMPGWNAPVDLDASSPPERRGRFEDLEFDDGAAGSLAGTKLYLPAGYETSGERYPLVVVQQSDGGDSARIEHIFDHEIGETAAPIVAVFLPPLKHAQDLETFKHHADRIVDALIPFLDEHYRLCGGSANRLFVGTGSGAPVAVFTAFARPRVFGKLAAQSFFLGGLFGKLGAGAFSMAPQLQDRIMALVAQATEPPPELYLEWSAHESRDPASDLDALRDTRRLLAVLKQNGFAYRTHEVRGAPGYGSWRAQYGQILGTFFPRFTKCSAEP